MSEVVCERCELHEEVFPVADAQLRLLRLQVGQQRVRQVAHADAVLEAVVRGAREHEVARAQLLQVAQALEVGSVDDGHQPGVQVDVAVDGVVQQLTTTCTTTTTAAVITHPISSGSGVAMSLLLLHSRW